MTDSSFVDTNVVVYAFDDDEPARQRRAQDVLSEPEAMLVVSTQVLAEFFVTVTRKLERPLDASTARQAVSELAELPVVATDARLVIDAVDLAQEHQLSLWDALIVQAAVTAGCTTLLSEDLADGSVLAGVRVDNPFADITETS